MAPPRIPLENRVHDKYVVDPDSGCWNWTATKCRGYGRIAVGRRMVGAHRVMYELLVGPIPAGLQLDHLCRNTACVNPSHLEPVTVEVNVLRSNCLGARNAKATSCKRGHPFDDANTGRRNTGHRYCKACDSDRRRKP